MGHVVGLSLLSSWPEQGCEGGFQFQAVLLVKSLTLLSTDPCRHSATPAGTGAIAGPGPSQ